MGGITDKACLVGFPFKLSLLLFCFILIRDSSEGARGLKFNKSWGKFLSLINPEKWWELIVPDIYNKGLGLMNLPHLLILSGC